MDIKKILFISLIAIGILVSVSAVSAGFLDGLLGGEQQDNIIELDNITFNTTNITKFKVFNETEYDYGYEKWFIDENDTGYNIHIFNCSNLDKTDFDSLVVPTFKNQLDNCPVQTINGIVIYTMSANSGNHVGEPRYMAYIENRNQNTIVAIMSPDPNETVKIASTLKFK